MSINFHDEVQALKPEIIARRRDLHQHPELAFEEFRTAEIVANTLNDLGLEVQTGVGRTGVVAILEGAHDGPTLLIRADMDALPIEEANETEYASATPGKMHACGHDGHTSIGLAVARMLTERQQDIHGRIKFVFQPAEEIGEGAKAMVDDGVLQNPRPDMSIGLHLWNTLPIGKVAVTAGPIMAAADIWSCTITGSGGHGASPHETHDPIVAASQIVSAVQTIVSRNVKPLEMAVVTVGAIKGGDAFNVIPPTVELKGTIRTYSEDVKALVHKRLKEVCEGVASALQCEAEVTIQPMTLVVDNDPALTERVAAAAAEVVGAENVKQDERSMGSEDMSYLMHDIPGCYFFVGSANGERGLDYPHHNPRFDVDEEALLIGAETMAKAVASFMIPEV